MNLIRWIAVTLCYLLLLIIAVGCNSIGSENENVQSNFQQRLDQRVPGWMDRYEVPGVILALIKDGEIYGSGAYGFADLENQIRMTPETVCRVELISSPILATI